jgi:hypothetical protein
MTGIACCRLSAAIHTSLITGAQLSKTPVAFKIRICDGRLAARRGRPSNLRLLTQV